MIPLGLVAFNPNGMEDSLLTPEVLVNFTRRLSLKYTLTSERCAMKVMEEARKRVKSNADGIGLGSRNGISNDVHVDEDAMVVGMVPRRARSYSHDALRYAAAKQKTAYLILLIFPVKPHPLVCR